MSRWCRTTRRGWGICPTRRVSSSMLASTPPWRRCWRSGRRRTVPTWAAASPKPSAIRRNTSARTSAPRASTTISQQGSALWRLHGGRQLRQHALANPLSLINESLREQVASVQEQHVFSPSLLNTARFGFSRASYFFTGVHAGESVRVGSRASPSAPSSSAAARPRTAHRQSRGAAPTWAATTRTARNLFTEDDHVYWSRGTQSDRSRRLAAARPGQRPAGAGPVRAGLVQHARTTFLQGTVADLYRCPLAHRAGLALA